MLRIWNLTVYRGGAVCMRAPNETIERCVGVFCFVYRYVCVCVCVQVVLTLRVMSFTASAHTFE